MSKRSIALFQVHSIRRAQKNGIGHHPLAEPIFEARDPYETSGHAILAQELLQRGLNRFENLADQLQVQLLMPDVIPSLYP
jgi:hypothetical protein